VAIKKYIDNKTNVNLATTTPIDSSNVITQKESNTQSTNAPTSVSVSTTSSTTISTSTSSSTTASTTTHTNCYTIDKLVFGDLSDLGGELNVFARKCVDLDVNHCWLNLNQIFLKMKRITDQIRI